MKVIILRGISGGGKSTYSKQNFPEAVIVSADHLFIRDGEYRFDRTKLGQAHLQCKTNFMRALESKEPLILVDNTNTRASEMRPYLELGRQYGYEVQIHRIECDPEVAAKRNTHGVPLETIKRMARTIQDSKLPEDFPEEKVIHATY